MKKFISFPKIGDFKTALKELIHNVSYAGQDENGQPIYNHDSLPTLTFIGTVKLHGTNASVCFNNESGFWVQSRNSIITPTKDNAGFAFFAESRKDAYMEIINKIAQDNDIDLDIYTIALFGEFAGGNIQKGVALNQLEKSFYIFAVKIAKPQDPEFNSYWVDSTKYVNEDAKIYNVDMLTTYSIDIDLNNPKLAINDMIEITIGVETECPTAKHFGVSGIGEGVVWRTSYKNSIFRFKVKGEKHSVTKVKKLVQVDSEKLQNVSEFVNFAVTRNRVEQGITEICNGVPDKSKTGPFLSWIVNDILEEELSTMVDNNLEPNDVKKSLSTAARLMFFKACDDAW